MLTTGPQAIMQRLWRYRQLGRRACLLQSDVAASQVGFAHGQEEVSSSAASLHTSASSAAAGPELGEHFPLPLEQSIASFSGTFAAYALSLAVCAQSIC